MTTVFCARKFLFITNTPSSKLESNKQLHGPIKTKFEDRIAACPTTRCTVLILRDSQSNNMFKPQSFESVLYNMSKKRKASSGEDEAVIVDFLEKQNRPFSLQNMVDALQKHNIKKTAIERSLQSLIEQNTVTFKEYGKAKIYLYCQENIELPDGEEMLTIDNELKEKTTDATSITEKWKVLKLEIEELSSQLTLEQALQRKEDLEVAIHSMEKDLQLIKSGEKKLVSEDEKDRIEALYIKCLGEWKNRRRLLTDVTDLMSEAESKKPKQLMEEIGIETDADAGVELSGMPVIKRKPVRMKR